MREVKSVATFSYPLEQVVCDLADFRNRVFTATTRLETVRAKVSSFYKWFADV